MFISYPSVHLEQARGHIAEHTWERFFKFARRLGSRFPSLDEPARLPRAAMFTSAQRTTVDSLYQRFSDLSPGLVPGAIAAVGVSSLGVPASSVSSESSVVPVSGGPFLSGSGSACVIELGDSGSEASDTGVPVSSVSMGFSFVPRSGGPFGSESASASSIQLGGSDLEDSGTGVPDRLDCRKRTRRVFGREQPPEDWSTVSFVLKEDLMLVVPAPAPSEGSLMRRQRRRLNEKAKKAALLEDLPPAPS
jgi:hypothetical protein